MKTILKMETSKNEKSQKSKMTSTNKDDLKKSRQPRDEEDLKNEDDLK